MVCIKKRILKVVAFMQTTLAKIILMIGIIMCAFPVAFMEINDVDLVKGLFALAGVLFMLHMLFPVSKHEINLSKLKSMIHKKSKEDPSYKELEEEFKKIEIL